MKRLLSLFVILAFALVIVVAVSGGSTDPTNAHASYFKPCVITSPITTCYTP